LVANLLKKIQRTVLKGADLVSSAPQVSRVGSRRQSIRNWSRVLGLAGTLSLHGVAVQSLVLGSAPQGLSRFKLFFRVQGQLDHALEQLVGRQSGEILEHELFDIQAHEVAQL